MNAFDFLGFAKESDASQNLSSTLQSYCQPNRKQSIPDTLCGQHNDLIMCRGKVNLSPF